LGLVLGGLIILGPPGNAAAQCPNNCTGHGTCVPAPQRNRFECQCYEGWTGAACSQRVSERAKAKQAEEPVVVDIPEETDRDTRRRGGPIAGVRPLDEVTLYKWADLSASEQQLLKNLGWAKQTWDEKGSPRIVWPQAMYLPYEGLTSKQQNAARGFGLTAADWNAGRHIALLTHGGE
jgi:hypothetical protein